MSDSISRRDFCALAGTGLVVINAAACGGGGSGTFFFPTDGGATPSDGGVVEDLAQSNTPHDLAQGGGSPDLAKPGGCPGTVNAGAAVAIGMGTARFFSASGRSFFACRDAGGLFAVSAICTHSGCTTEFRANKMDFYCSCHGSDFSYTGAVLAGPAFSALVHYSCCIDNGGNLVIDPTKTVASATRV